MKKKITVITVLMVAIMMLLLVACDGGLGGGETPGAQDWKSLGFTGEFDAQVNGTLETNVVDGGSITMKWTGSDEQSLDNTIAWLKEQGFDSYGGQSAEKTTEEGGFMKSYTASKTVSGGGFSLDGLFAFAESGDKTVIAETYYITADFSLMGHNFKGGDLFLEVYEQGGNNGGNMGDSNIMGSTAEWPSANIQSVIGVSVPQYTGNADGFYYVNGDVGYLKSVQVSVFGANNEDAVAYAEVLTDDGYVLNDDTYDKTLSNGDVIHVSITVSLCYNPETYQMVNGMNVYVNLEKNSGEYSSWSALNIAGFDGAGVPTYNGGTSYDIANVVSEISGMFDQYEQIISQLGPMEGFLDAETKAQLNEAKRIVELAKQIKAYNIVVYGTNENEAEAYENAVASAGYSHGLKNVGDYQYSIEVEQDGNKAIIILTRMPKELGEEIDNSGGNDNDYEDEDDEYTPPVVEPVYNLPTNLKVEYTDSSFNYVAIKIGDDYFQSFEMYGIIEYTYFKKNGNVWDCYYRDNYTTEWTKGSNTEADREDIESNVFDFIVNKSDVDFEKTGTDTILGKTVDVLFEDTSFGDYTITETVYRDATTGLVFKVVQVVNDTDITYEVTSYDTTVTSFGIDLPQ